MYYDKFLPFLNQSLLVRERREMVSSSEVFCPLLGAVPAEQPFGVQKTIPKVIHVLPLNIKVFDMSDDFCLYYKNLPDMYEANVVYLDYSSVARDIDFQEGGRALIRVNRDYLHEEGILSEAFVNTAANDSILSMEDALSENIEIVVKEKVNLFDLSTDVNLEYFGESLTEEHRMILEAGKFKDLASISKAFKDTKGKVITVRGKVQGFYDAYESWLEGYLTSPPGGEEQVPLLIGPTGVFKSASVKAICKKHSDKLRFVDFRVAFTSRLDYSGLLQVIEVEGQKYNYNCPMEELVTCSDGFREYCRQALEFLQDILDKGYQTIIDTTDGGETQTIEQPLTEEQRDGIIKLINQYKEYVKTPVLFFDEITRCTDEGVEQVLTTLLNQKKLMNMTLEGCKFIAATNSGLGDDVLNQIYQAKNQADSAYARRFIPMQINPQEVKERWLNWAKGQSDDVQIGSDGLPVLDEDGNPIKVVRQNIHSNVLRYLEKHSSQIYNEYVIKQAYNNSGMDVGEAVLSPFPNYRTWDMTSKYLYTVDELHTDPNAPKMIVKDTIAGLIGIDAAELFIKFLIDEVKGYALVTDSKGTSGQEEDEMDRFIRETLHSGTPALVVGPSSMGKTSRIKQYAKSIGAELIVITMASLDRVNLVGFPSKVSLNSYVARNTEIPDSDGISQGLSSIIDKVRNDPDKKYGLSPQLSVKAPDIDLKTKFEKCVRERKPVVLFFDECNRVPNPVIMSAMFEAVSDCFVGDTKIRLLDGTVKTIKEMYEEFQEGKEFWVYSCKPDGEVVPGRVTNARVVSGEDKVLVRVTLDNGKFEVCTDYHLWMMRDGSYRQAKELKPGDSLMPLYSKSSKEDGKDIPEVAVNYNHKVVSIEYLPYREKVYDIEVDEYHNFALDSGVFVHNSRIFGITFNPRYVKIIAACNYGENYHSARELDAALAARFSIFRKKGYDEKDVHSFIRYLEREDEAGKNANGIIVKYFKNIIDTKGVQAAVDIIKQVESEEIEIGVPSTRAFTTMSRDIANMANSREYCGSVLFNNTMKENLLSKMADLFSESDYPEKNKAFNFFKSALDTLLVDADSWAATKGEEETIKIGEEVTGASDLLEMLQILKRDFYDNANYAFTLSDDEFYDLILHTRSAINNAHEIDERIKEGRKKQFSFYLGDIAGPEFAQFFNAHFGGPASVMITIPMLKDDIKLIAKYTAQITSGTSVVGQDLITGFLFKFIKEFYDEYKDSLPSKFYEEVINCCISCLDNNDDVRAFFNLMDQSYDSFMVKAEESGDQFIMSCVSKAGFTIDKTIIDEYRNRSKKSKTGVSLKSRLL